MLSAVNQYADIYQTTAPASPSPKDVDSSSPSGLAATRESKPTTLKL